MKSHSIFNSPSKKNEVEENIFYTVGLPIEVQVINFWGPRPRKNIPDKEITASFSKEIIGEKKLRLFKTEEEALEYSRSLRKGIGFYHMKPAEEVSQPAIFTVHYLGNASSIAMKNETLIINQKVVHLASDNDLPESDEKERTFEVQYFEATRDEVIPLKGQLKLRYGSEGKLLIHKPVSYTDIENKSSFECRIS